MANCKVCGGQNFELHAGYMYCLECQTQSHDYHEQEHEFQVGDASLSQKAKKSVRKKKTKEFDDGTWLSWEAFNYIIYGMTQELKALGATPEFEVVVLQLWSCYLQRSKVAFTSTLKEEAPRLRLLYKNRDARLLYNLQLKLPKRRRSRSRSRATTSDSSVTSSKHVLSRKKKKIVASDYADHLSATMRSEGSTSLANETLESLGRSSDLDSTLQMNVSEVKIPRHSFTDEAYMQLKRCSKSYSLMSNSKKKSRRDTEHLQKNKLLSIIHLSLLLTGNKIQLGDLLRFIREGHLSYAKVTHFLPQNVRFSSKDFLYIETVADPMMPTHLKIRRVGGELVRYLEIPSIPCPNLEDLVGRYCRNLQLPMNFIECSIKILSSNKPKRLAASHSRFIVPNYEAWAMAFIIFTMKLLFGLDGRTEVVLSDIARKINTLNDSFESRLFVFQDWQKYVECRNVVLNDFHFATQEQLCLRPFSGSNNFIDMLIRESRDEHRSKRFIPYAQYHMDANFAESIKHVLSKLTVPENVNLPEFEPSLTPQLSYVEALVRTYEENSDTVMVDDELEPDVRKFPVEVLTQDFSQCDVMFTRKPGKYLKMLQDHDLNDLSEFCTVCLVKYSNEDAVLEAEPNDRLENEVYTCKMYKEGNRVSIPSGEETKHLKVKQCVADSNYWILNYPSSKSRMLNNFKEEVFEKTSENFQWLVSECARVVEMNIRDLYDELLLIENMYGFVVPGKMRMKKIRKLFHDW